jgi:H/ACA ribonucleoprotein complex non-core subunit NAF1
MPPPVVTASSATAVSMPATNDDVARPTVGSETVNTHPAEAPQQLDTESADPNSLLDALMLQVEAESIPALTEKLETQPAESVTGSVDKQVPAVAQYQESSIPGLNSLVESHWPPNARDTDVEAKDVDMDASLPVTSREESQVQSYVEPTTAVPGLVNPEGSTLDGEQKLHFGDSDQAEKEAVMDTEVEPTNGATKDTSSVFPPLSQPAISIPGLENVNDPRLDSLFVAPPDSAVNAQSGQQDNTQNAAEARDTTPFETTLATDPMAAIPTISSDTAVAPETGSAGAEWEYDSSPYESSDSDSSSDTTSDEDEDYPMLDPEEAIRMLIEADGVSDDERGISKVNGGTGGLRTANERPEEIVPRPDIVVTEEMSIEELGNIEFAVEGTILIKATISGEYQVLESGSLICLKDRSVVGVIADLIGRVEEPRYTVRFTNDDELAAAGVSEIGTTVFYVPQHSTFVFTQPLKAVKGSDASNFHDEEVGEDEMEFSDDEAEADHKRQIKMRKRLADGGSRRGGGRTARGAHRGGRGGASGLATHAESANYDMGEINYDDVPDNGEEGYTPLQRPLELSSMMMNDPHSQSQPTPPTLQMANTGRGDFRGRGRGFNRGGHGNNRGNRGRGGFNQNQQSWSSNNNNNNNNNNNSHPGFQNPYAPQNWSSNGTAPPHLNLPTTPSITPNNVNYPPMTPSPMTPLPNVPFGFGNFQPLHPQPGNMNMNMNFGYNMMQQRPPFMQNYGQAQQQQSQYQQPQSQPQQQQHQTQQPQTGQNQQQQQQYTPNQYQTPNAGGPGQWANNPAFAEAFRRQLEQHKRNQG